MFMVLTLTFARVFKFHCGDSPRTPSLLAITRQRAVAQYQAGLIKDPINVNPLDDGTSMLQKLSFSYMASFN